MKAEGWIVTFIGGFFLLVAPIYFWITQDPIGGVALGLSAGVGGIIAFYLFVTGKNLPLRPEDDKDGEIVQGAGDLGFFPPSSIWPLWVTLSLGVILLGPIFGWWLSILGIGIGLWATSGWVFQFYKGDYQH